MHIVLHEPEIPQNTGNIGRTCVALQAKLWLVRPLGFQLDHARLKRAGLDYWEFLDWEAVSNWEELVEKIPTHQFWFFTKRATREYTTAKFEPEDALVFGRESRGLPDSLLTDPERNLGIPMDGPVRSLNLATAVAIAAYHARFQLQQHDG